MRTRLKSGTGLLVLPLTVLMIGLAVSGRRNETAKINTNTYSDPIKNDTGYISGTVIGDIGKEVHIYRGIPYAAPPVGNLRWNPSQPATPWQGIREIHMAAMRPILRPKWAHAHSVTCGNRQGSA